MATNVDLALAEIEYAQAVLARVKTLLITNGPAPPPQPPPSPPTDDAPALADVLVLGSNPACLTFPITCRLESIAFDGETMRIRSAGAEHWPAVDIDRDGNPDQSATLWIFLRIAGKWYAAGAERLRPAQVNGDKPEGSVADLVGTGWLYDANRWGAMAGYNPRTGESVGFMLVAGSTRSDDNTPVRERSNLLMVRW